LELDLGRLTVLCGPNSCGKTNVLRALEFAFKPDISGDDAYGNLTWRVRDQTGGAAIWVTVTLEDCPKVVADLVGAQAGSRLTYSLKAGRNDKPVRKLGNVKLLDEQSRILCEQFTVVYIPPVRDIEAGGLEPFRRLLAIALRRGKGVHSHKSMAAGVRQRIEERARLVLPAKGAPANQIIGAQGLHVNTESINLDYVYNSVGIAARLKGRNIPIEELGTGHQSVVAMSAYQQLGEWASGETLFLFEEPDNHLHPSTIRAIASLLESISTEAQVVATTHSPVMLNRVGFGQIRGLAADPDRCTRRRNIDLSKYSDKQRRQILAPYNISASEALLANSVLVVEGINDAAIIRQLLDLEGVDPDHADAIIIPAGGKDKVVEICRLLHSLDVNWKAVFDWDAALSPDVPYTVAGMNTAQTGAVRNAIGVLRTAIDANSKRGRGIVKNLNAVDNELQQGRPSPRLYDGSALEQLVKSVAILSATEQADLKARIRATQVRKYGSLLAKTRVWLWPGEIEDALLVGTPSQDIVEACLRSHGLLAASPTAADRQNVLRNKLKDISAFPVALADIVTSLDNAARFRYSAVSSALHYICSDLA